MPLQKRLNEQFREWRHTLTIVWCFHFVSSTAMILWASTHYEEENRKYIPIDQNTIKDQCVKAYANVFASSMEEDGAIMCCTPDFTDGICRPTPWYLPFANRLARLPEAWLLPLFPLLVRWAVEIFGLQRQETPNNATFRRRRFYLYLCLIQLRGWVLYLLFDKFEDLVIKPARDECWYDELLWSHQNSCVGKETDFSDHIVLFFAQILPLALTEVQFSFVAPYWKENSILVPGILSLGLFYLYIISYIATYKTTAHFHTLFESSIGYLITLTVQIPLFVITTTSFSHPVRDYFFGI